MFDFSFFESRWWFLCSSLWDVFFHSKRWNFYSDLNSRWLMPVFHYSLVSLFLLPSWTLLFSFSVLAIPLCCYIRKYCYYFRIKKCMNIVLRIYWIILFIFSYFRTWAVMLYILWKCLTLSLEINCISVMVLLSGLLAGRIECYRLCFSLQLYQWPVYQKNKSQFKQTKNFIIPQQLFLPQTETVFKMLLPSDIENLIYSCLGYLCMCTL